jgi:hypothetical protein
MQAILFQVDQMFCLFFIISFMIECVVVVVVVVVFSVQLVKEQRICVKSCFIVGKTAAETHNMMREAYDNDASFASPQKSTTDALASESNVDCGKLASLSQ